MRRITRLRQPSDILLASRCAIRSTQLADCWVCQHRAPRHTAALSTASSCRNPDFLERTRRRIWGTESPPGADDPYTGKSRRIPNSGHFDGEVLTVGGDEAQAAQDAKLYEQQALREARELYQQSVDVAIEHGDYVPANTWDGLEIVGGEQDWDNGDMFHGFKPPQKLETPEEITMAIYRATVEVFLAASAGESLTALAEPQAGALVSAAKDVRIRVDGETVKLEFSREDIIQKLVASIKGTSKDDELATLRGSQAPNYTTESLQRDLRGLGRAWLHAPLTSTAIKFAIVRRIIQLTGIHVPDHVISEAKSVAILVSKLTVPPKHQRLADELSGGALPTLSNVRLMQKRDTPIDKEKRVGRWKLIEEELVQRDLPVVGRW